MHSSSVFACFLLIVRLTVPLLEQYYNGFAPLQYCSKRRASLLRRLPDLLLSVQKAVIP